LLAGHGETVLELSRTPRAERCLRGKDDSLDAARTARAALAAETIALPRSGERREALRLLLVARRSAVDVRREALGQLRGVIVTAPSGCMRSCAGCRSRGCSSATSAICTASRRPLT
jgi:transposase